MSTKRFTKDTSNNLGRRFDWLGVKRDPRSWVVERAVKDSLIVGSVTHYLARNLVTGERAYVPCRNMTNLY